jgi:Na+/H+ antiporter NhaD/arsenite permease-like protein
MPLPISLLALVFVAGYVLIILEHNTGIDKVAASLLTGVLCWTVYTLGAPELINVDLLPPEFLASQAGNSPDDIARIWVAEHQLMGRFGEIASILFFLLGAMTIVEMVDTYGGFEIITDRIHARSMASLLWVIGIVTFFLSAALDNLTTTIVMISLIRKLVAKKEERLWFAGLIVIAANAGGAWSPIGDVTTTMLWIGGQISSAGIIRSMFLPSLACLLVPLALLSLQMRGQMVTPPVAADSEARAFTVSRRHRNIMFAAGMGGLLFVPVFKTLTHLPPFMGMLFSLGVVWVISELLHEDRDAALDSGMHVLKVLRRIDTPSVLFFLGILTAVSALEATGLLRLAADALGNLVGQIHVIVFLIGLLSAVVDNVPLVAAVMGMYDLGTHPSDDLVWLYLAFAAGTGGSCLIIGSAAGVAAMGMERINFFWYMRHIGILAFAGYLAGTAVVFLPRLL